MHTIYSIIQKNSECLKFTNTRSRSTCVYAQT